MPTVLTFESWLTKRDWYEYATAHPNDIPFTLIDRSMCTDPFFDHYTQVSSARPILSGLCRTRKNYEIGERFIYVTNVHRDVLERLGRPVPTLRGAVYLGVAELVVRQIHPSHDAAARTFSPARYAAAPNPTAYPPNLAHDRNPNQAVARECCITHDIRGIPHRPHTPATSTHGMYRAQYLAYHLRQEGLPVAECRFAQYDAVPALVLDPLRAPIFTAADWGAKLNVKGRLIAASVADSLGARIAAAR